MATRSTKIRLIIGLIAHARKSVRGGKTDPDTAKILSEVSMEFAERLEHSGLSASAK